jgi:hypothetical protein
VRFNPVYAQGMATGALGAEALDACLREQRRARGAGDLAGLSRAFQRRLASHRPAVLLAIWRTSQSKAEGAPAVSMPLSAGTPHGFTRSTATAHREALPRGHAPCARRRRCSTAHRLRGVTR